MDDRHWFLNTTFSGFLLVVFFIFTSWAVTGEIPYEGKLFENGEYNLLKIAGLATAAMLPLLGMFVKILSIVFFRTFFQYKACAWKLMGEFSKERLQFPFKGQGNRIIREIFNELENADTEPLVTWLRINRDTKEMSEWRRNRGHYMHVAENSLTATILGFAFSIAWMQLSGHGGDIFSGTKLWLCVGGECISNPEWNLILGSVFFVLTPVLWVCILIKLRCTMHKNNNNMLLIWMLENMGLAVKEDVLSIRSLQYKIL